MERRHVENDTNTYFFPKSFQSFHYVNICILEFSKFTTWQHFSCLISVMIQEILVEWGEEDKRVCQVRVMNAQCA